MTRQRKKFSRKQKLEAVRQLEHGEKTLSEADRETYAMPTNDYPRLAEMGIQNPLQIDRYQVNGMSNYEVLRVIFEVGGGSFLPSTRTYKFPRVQKNAKVDKNNDKTQAVMESHPDLRKALHELEALFATKDCKECLAETVIEELQSLEEEVAIRSAYIKELINQL